MGETGVLRPIAYQEERNNMKKTMLSIALAAVAPFAWGQVSSTTNTTTTEGGGTITEFTPGSAIVLREKQRSETLPLRQDCHLRNQKW